MTDINFVFPNVSELRPKRGRPRRGGLSSRVDLARDLGCEYLEIPCDFIKNGGEVEMTGLEMGSPLTPAAIATLYDAETGSAPLPYIIHTEPSLPRMDGCGLRMQAALRWYDAEWVEKLVAMVVGVAERLNAAPTAVEIHPGDKRNGNGNVVEGMIAIRDAFEEKFGASPAVLLENRNDGQFIGTGKGIARFWEHLVANAPELAGDCGVVLDVSQLHTNCKNRNADLLADLDAIPRDALKAFHIHRLHRFVPSFNDPIPWTAIFALIRDLDRPVLINPEVHHLSLIEPTMEFCRALLATDR